MGKTDRQVKFMLVILILVYLPVSVIGITVHKAAWLIAVANLLLALSLLIYWSQKQICVQQHFLELREIIVLSYEAVVVGCSAYLLISRSNNNLMEILSYIFAGLHFLFLVSFFIFMLTFKIKRLI